MRIKETIKEARRQKWVVLFLVMGIGGYFTITPYHSIYRVIGCIMLGVAGIMIAVYCIVSYLDRRDEEREKREVAAINLLWMLQKLGASAADLEGMRDAVVIMRPLPPSVKEVWDEVVQAEWQKELEDTIARIEALPPSARTAWDEAILAKHLEELEDG